MTPIDFTRLKSNFLRNAQPRVSTGGVALVFAVTFGMTWLLSHALRTIGLDLPLRYAVAGVSGYAVFAMCVRVWAEFQRPKHLARANGVPGGTDSSSGADALELGADVAGEAIGTLDIGEAAVIFIPLLILVAVLVGAVALFSGGGLVAVLLEVAFEVAFAGTVVRGLRGKEMVGDWLGVLLRKTAWMAALAVGAMVAFAWWGTQRFPQADTMGQLLALLWRSL